MYTIQCIELVAVNRDASYSTRFHSIPSQAVLHAGSHVTMQAGSKAFGKCNWTGGIALKGLDLNKHPYSLP